MAGRLVKFLTEGDILVAPSHDRYGRTMKELITMVAVLQELRAAGADAAALTAAGEP